MNRNSAELKAEAKASLLGKYGTVIGASVLIELVTLAITWLASSIVPTTSVIGMIIYYTISFIIGLISSVFSVGLIYLNMNIIRNRPYKISDIFYCFSAHPDKAIIIQFLLSIISLVCLLPAIILFALYTSTENPVLMMFVSLFGIIGAIVMVVVSLWFSQAFYLIPDCPDHSAIDIMKLSKEMMKGNCGRLFYINISFIPMLLLGLLSCGIGLIFIIPYIHMTKAHFYVDIIK